MDGMKRCPGCGERKAFSEFSKNKVKKNGIDSYCKACKKLKSHNDYAANPEKFLKRNKKWEVSNPKKSITRKIRFLIKNPFKVREYAHAARARKFGTADRITEKEWKDVCEKYGNRCLRCGRSDVKLTLDHIVPLKDGGLNVISNAQPLCMPCNSSKGDDHTDYRP